MPKNWTWIIVEVQNTAKVISSAARIGLDRGKWGGQREVKQTAYFTHEEMLSHLKKK